LTWINSLFDAGQGPLKVPGTGPTLSLGKDKPRM